MAGTVAVMVDTNVLLDLVAASRPAHAETLRAMRAALQAGMDLRCLASSLKDVYYVYQRHYGSEPAARTAIRYLRETLTVLDLTTTMVDAALRSDEPDYEDGLVRAGAELTGCSYLLTRDTAGFVQSTARKVEAAELARLAEAAG